jgi:hypothetical protein
MTRVILGAVLSPHRAWHGPLPAQRFLATRQFPGALCVMSESATFDKTLTFREHFGDYERQLFLMDHAGLPLATVLEQLLHGR